MKNKTKTSVILNEDVFKETGLAERLQKVSANNQHIYGIGFIRTAKKKGRNDLVSLAIENKYDFIVITEERGKWFHYYVRFDCYNQN